MLEDVWESPLAVTEQKYRILSFQYLDISNNWRINFFIVCHHLMILPLLFFTYVLCRHDSTKLCTCDVMTIQAENSSQFICNSDQYWHFTTIIYDANLPAVNYEDFLYFINHEVGKGPVSVPPILLKYLAFIFHCESVNNPCHSWILLFFSLFVQPYNTSDSVLFPCYPWNSCDRSIILDILKLDHWLYYTLLI